MATHKVWRLEVTKPSRNGAYVAVVEADTAEMAEQAALRKMATTYNVPVTALAGLKDRTLTGVSINMNAVQYLAKTVAAKIFGKDYVDAWLSKAVQLTQETQVTYVLLVNRVTEQWTVTDLSRVPSLCASGYKVVGNKKEFVGAN